MRKIILAIIGLGTVFSVAAPTLSQELWWERSDDYRQKVTAAWVAMTLLDIECIQKRTELSSSQEDEQIRKILSKNALGYADVQQVLESKDEVIQAFIVWSSFDYKNALARKSEAAGVNCAFLEASEKRQLTRRSMKTFDAAINSSGGFSAFAESQIIKERMK